MDTLVRKENHKQQTKISIRDIIIGDKKIIVMAGPCAIETKKQLGEISLSVKNAGAGVLRGGGWTNYRGT